MTRLVQPDKKATVCEIATCYISTLLRNISEYSSNVHGTSPVFPRFPSPSTIPGYGGHFHNESELEQPLGLKPTSHVWGLEEI